MAETNTHHTDHEVHQDLLALQDELNRSHGAAKPHDWGEMTVIDDDDDIEALMRSLGSKEADHSSERSIHDYIDQIKNAEAMVKDGNLDEKQMRGIRELSSRLSTGAYSTETAKNVTRSLLDLEWSLKHEGQGARIAACLERMPRDVLREIYFDPNNETNDLRAFLSDENNDTRGPGFNRVAVKVRLLAKIYTDDKGKVSFPENDAIAVEVSSEIDSDIKMLIAGIPEWPEGDTERDLDNYQDRVMGDALMVQRGLDLYRVTKNGRAYSPYLASASTRLQFNYLTDKADDQIIDVQELRHELHTHAELVDALGAANIATLREKLGIENWWVYEESDLRTLLGVVNNDKETIQFLQDGDVSVVFSDMLNDHNGAISNNDQYIKKSGRTLRFELTLPSSMYRLMGLLRSRGIKPATFVYAAHGVRGGITLPNDGIMWAEKDFMRDDDPKYADKDMYLDPTAGGLYTLADKYMQPNKGVDCEAELIGKKQLIVHSCDGDSMYRNGDDISSFLEQVAHAATHPRDPEPDKPIDNRPVLDNVVLYGADTLAFGHKTPDGRAHLMDFLAKKYNNQIATATVKLTPGTTIENTRRQQLIRRVKVPEGIPVDKVS